MSDMRVVCVCMNSAPRYTESGGVHTLPVDECIRHKHIDALSLYDLLLHLPASC